MPMDPAGLVSRVLPGAVAVILGSATGLAFLKVAFASGPVTTARKDG